MIWGSRPFKNFDKGVRRKVRDLNHAWIERLSESDGILGEKMTLFWANVFVCRDNHIFHIQQYHNTLTRKCFREL